MDHGDHVRLIRDAVVGAGTRWLELGAGEGAFTLALADLLAPLGGGTIVAVDRAAPALRRLSEELTARFPATSLRTIVGDFRHDLPDGPFDGLLAANSLHFVSDPVAALRAAVARLRPGAVAVVVEYDADRGNPWVPHPFSVGRFREIAAAAGLEEPRELARVPSRFLGAIYSARASVPAARTAEHRVLHSRPHGGDREE